MPHFIISSHTHKHINFVAVVNLSMCGLTLTLSEYAFFLQYIVGTHRLYHPHLHYVIIIYIHTRQHRLALASMTNCSDSQLLFSSCSVHAAGLCGKEMLRQRDQLGIVPDSVLTTTSNKLIVGLDLNRFLVFVEMILCLLYLSKGYQ